MASLGTLITTFGANLTPLDKAVIKAEKQFLRVQQQGVASFKKITHTVLSLKSTIAGIALTAVSKKFIDTADDLLMVKGRLKLVTDSTEDLIRVEDELYRVSERARVGYSATADLYARIGRNVKELGISEEKLLRVTENISKAMIVSGASATESNAAMIQLSQGLASGALRGDELRSVLEQTPRLAQAMAEGLGVPIGKLRELGMEGKLTSELIIEALLSQTEAIEKEFSQMPMTVGQSVSVVMNTINRILGYLNEQFGITDKISTKLIDFANWVSVSKNEIIDFVERGIKALINAMQILLIVTEAYMAYRLASYFYTATTFVVTLAGSLSTLSKAITALYASTIKLTAATKGGLIGLFLFGFYEGFKWVFDKFDIVKEFMFSLIGTFMRLFEQAKFGIMDSWKYVYYGIVKTLSSIIDKLNEFVNWAASGLPDWFRSWLGMSEGDFKPLVNPYAGLADNLAKELEAAKLELKKALDEIDDMVINAMLGIRLPEEVVNKKVLEPKIDTKKYEYNDTGKIQKLLTELNKSTSPVSNKSLEDEAEKIRKYTDSKLNAYKSMYEDMGNYSTRFYENERKLISMQAVEYANAGVDSDTINKWTDYKERELKKSELVDTGGFFGGMQSGLMDLEDTYNKSFARMGEFGKSTFENVYQSFEDTIYNGLKGDFKSIDDLWKNTWNDMTNEALRMFSKMIMEMMMQKAIMPVISSAASGVGSFMSGIFGAAEGGVFSGPTTGYPMVMHGTEAVIPLKNGRVPVELNDIGISAESKSVSVNMYISTPDANSFNRSRSQIVNDMRRAIL